MKRVLFPLAVLFLALSALTFHTHAQAAPLPYGNVEVGGPPQPCPANGAWVQGETCVPAVMICDASLNVDLMGFTYGYLAPSPSVTYKGTVVAFSGGPGEEPATSQGQEVKALQAYLNAGYEIVQVEWDSPWEQSQFSFTQGAYGNIQYAACRPAGLLHYVYTNPVLFQPGNNAGMCAHGFSAGSAAVVYALSWYGAGWGATSYLDNVELLSGPVLSEIDIGCEIPQTIQTVNVCSGAAGWGTPSLGAFPRNTSMGTKTT